MSAAHRRRLSTLEQRAAPVAPVLHLFIVNKAGSEHGNGDDQIIGIDGDSTRPVVYRLDDEPVDEMVKRAKAQIVGGGVHIMRFIRK